MHPGNKQDKPGFLCSLGRSDLAAGFARGATAVILIGSGFVGAVLLWWVNDLRSDFDGINNKFATVFERLNSIDTKVTTVTDHLQADEGNLGRLQAASDGHEQRITCLEYQTPCRPTVTKP